MIWSYSLAMTTRPAPCEVVSHWFQAKPNWNGSVAAWATARCSALLQVGDQVVGAHREAGRVAGLGDGAPELVVGEPETS